MEAALLWSLVALLLRFWQRLSLTCCACAMGLEWIESSIVLIVFRVGEEGLVG